MNQIEMKPFKFAALFSSFFFNEKLLEIKQIPREDGREGERERDKRKQRPQRES